MAQKYLIINADDFGLCKSANDAVIDLFRSNCIFSSTVMMTCPGTDDAVKFAAENPQYAIGVHLTLTNEWQDNCPWGPLTDGKTIRNEKGRMWPENEDFEMHCDYDEAIAEAKAQIEKAENMGMKPSQVDNHMGSLYGMNGKYLMLPKVFKLCKEKGYVLPTVYEGLYNPLSRKAEEELFDALRNFNMRFYAYNPLAGGLLTNKYSSFEEEPTKGRFTFRPNYQNRYWKKSFFDGAALIKKACEREGISIIEASYRWMAYHSALQKDDAIIVGASKVAQLEQNISALDKGPLSNEMLEAFDEAWKITKADAPAYFKFYGA